MSQAQRGAKKQIVWDFGRQSSTPTAATSAMAAPAFALEPPGLVEYLNSTGAVIACRPTLAGLVEPTEAPASMPAAAASPRRAPISLSWRRQLGAGLEIHEQLESSSEWAEWRELDEQESTRSFVRQDGALILPPNTASSGEHIFRCCLSNQFGSLCSRPVRTRTGEYQADEHLTLLLVPVSRSSPSSERTDLFACTENLSLGRQPNRSNRSKPSGNNDDSRFS